jgi:hypothetical protein
MQMRLHYLEALGSLLVVGLGQIIKGETQKGLSLLLVFYFALPAFVYLALLVTAQYFLYALAAALILGIMIWVYSVGDALLIA